MTDDSLTYLTKAGMEKEMFLRFIQVMFIHAQSLWFPPVSYRQTTKWNAPLSHIQFWDSLGYNILEMLQNWSYSIM